MSQPQEAAAGPQNLQPEKTWREERLKASDEYIELKAARTIASSSELFNPFDGLKWSKVLDTQYRISSSSGLSYDLPYESRYLIIPIDSYKFYLKKF